MNREDLERKEVDREVGKVPASMIRLEILTEKEPGSGKYSGEILQAHGYDDIGTFVYRSTRKKKGSMRYKQYRLFPFGKHVMVNVIGE